MDLLDPLIQSEIDAGYITRRPHPKYDLFVLNYAPPVQYERRWNEATMACRGLIVDGTGRVVARPFKKFFNIGEHESPALPDLPIGDRFKAFEKMDGSLGISYATPDGLAISTRGSFESEQAIKATEMLRTTYKDAVPKMHGHITYLFEIIYPENRIVVNYGDAEELVLIGAICTKSGLEYEATDFPELPFRTPEVFTVEDLKDLPRDTSNFEGYVIMFEDGPRVKVKLDEYVKLHHLVHDMSPRRIWEALSSGENVEAMIAELPDELFDDLKAQVQDQKREFEHEVLRYRRLFKHLELHKIESRKDQAMTIIKMSKFHEMQPGPLFSLLDVKSSAFVDSIWKLVKP